MKDTPAVLHRRWIGSGPVDLPRVAEVIRREIRAANSGRILVTAGCLTGMRADAIRVGKLRAGQA